MEMRRLAWMMALMTGCVGLTGCGIGNGPIESDIQGYCYDLMDCGFGYFQSYEECVAELKWTFRAHGKCSEEIEDYYECVMNWKCYEESYSSLAYSCGNEGDDLDWCIEQHDVVKSDDGDDYEEDEDAADLAVELIMDFLEMIFG